MIVVIDTNVVSEMMRLEPDLAVMEWVGRVGRLHTTAITVAEVEHGIARLPAGRRKERLAAVAAEVFADFGELILPFDAPAGHRYGRIVADRERAGRPITTADAQIAAICASAKATLATRNTRDFDGTGVSLVNPWQWVSTT
ncbi:type II toxin-antitoxin system VapC family toxin [Flexivirga alba]|uniref:Ribonuclease VapC n=1 Tax=Flexivirga alba TaxID=702742 RepID=A0ABW2AKF0_9MICO